MRHLDCLRKLAFEIGKEGDTHNVRTEDTHAHANRGSILLSAGMVTPYSVVLNWLLSFFLFRCLTCLSRVFHVKEGFSAHTEHRHRFLFSWWNVDRSIGYVGTVRRGIGLDFFSHYKQKVWKIVKSIYNVTVEELFVHISFVLRRGELLNSGEYPHRVFVSGYLQQKLVCSAIRIQ